MSAIDLCHNQSTLLRIGFTKALISQLLGKPDHTRNCGRFSNTEYLWLPGRVERARQAPEFLAFAERRAVRKTASARRHTTFAERYPDWRHAIPDACHYLHELNRYAKHLSSNDQRR